MAWLRNLKLNRVDLVDQGANQHAHVVLVKRRAPVEKAGPDLAAVHVDRPIGGGRPRAKEPRVAKPTQTSKSLIARAFAVLAKAAGHEPAAAPGAEGTPPQPLDTLRAHHASLGKAIEGFGDCSKLGADHPVHAMKAMHEALGKALEAYGPAPTDAAADPNADDLSDLMVEDEEKRMDPAVAKQLTDVQKRLEAAEKIAKAATDRAEAAEKVAKAERDQRETAELTTALRKFKGVSVDLTKDVALFKSLRAADAAAYDRVMQILDGADAAIAKAAFAEIGSGHSGGGSAWAQLEAKAASIIEKSKTPLTKQQAMDRVLTDPSNAALVREYRQGQ